jgi:hypothetical protein
MGHPLVGGQRDEYVAAQGESAFRDKLILWAHLLDDVIP